MSRLLNVLLLAGACVPALAADLPIFDAHIHYSHDAWETVPPKDAIAILRKALRSANVRTTESTKLLVLDAYDLRTLSRRNPKIGEAIQSTARRRSEFRPQPQQGDMIAAELLRDDVTENGDPQ